MAEAVRNDQNGDVIKQGFICPMCHKEFPSSQNLLSHYDEHSAQKSLKEYSSDILSKISAEFAGRTRKKTEPTEAIFEKLTLQESVPVPPGVTRSHIEEFKRIRRERLDHRTAETNMLIIRLDRLLRCEGADRKQAAQDLVLWIDGKNVTRCPNCTVKFNIARRQHHCRLCGVIMCNSCSEFLSFSQARIIVGPFGIGNSSQINEEDNESESIRLCLYCNNILESRKNIQISQHSKPPICESYEQLQKLIADIEPSVELYYEMHSSLTIGDSIYHLKDAQSLHATIARKAETIDHASKQLSQLPPMPDIPLVSTLQATIRRATFHYIKEHLATLPLLPSPQEIERIKSARVSRLERSAGKETATHVKKVIVTTGWSASANVEPAEVCEDDDPLIVQINIVRGYIEQAREAQRFEEVATLSENLRALKEVYRKLNNES